MKNTITKNIAITISFAMLVMLSACTQNLQGYHQPSGSPASVPELSFEGDDIKKFESFEELESFLSLLKSESSYTERSSATFGGMDTFVAADTSAESVSAPKSASGYASDFSETNVQIEGVDEADIVKNDGRYIYLVSGQNLMIIDAADPEAMEILSTVEIEKKSYYYSGSNAEIFINDDRLILFSTVDEESYRFAKYDIRPIPSYRTVTKARIYDISDRESPEILEEYSVSGDYVQSRMIGSNVYLITSEYTGYDHIARPLILSDENVMHPDVYYFTNLEQEYNYNTVVSFDISSAELLEAKTFLLGYSNTIMMSEDNLYIAYHKSNLWRWFGGYIRQYEKERFFEVVLPLLEGELKQKISEITQKNLDEEEEWEQIEKELILFFESADNDSGMQDEYEEMFEEIGDALIEYDTKKELENSRTVIHRIGIDKGKITPASQGEVDGRLLNQFSMDEHEGNLRVATTVSIWVHGRVQYNNVYVLDSNMEIIGEIEKIAENESVYSSRFIGDRLYLVTFEKIDPFFVIDLSSPRNPEILGELKITGFSSYLHPFNEEYIIGIGQETADEKWGVRTKGVKIALFDAGDPSNPELVDKVEIGDEGSSTPVSSDHRAFLFRNSDGLLVIPVIEVNSGRDDYFNDMEVWNGAYAFTVSEKGFEKIGKVKHSRSDRMYYWGSMSYVKRSLYIDNTLFTISSDFLKSNDISDGLKELDSIKFEDETNKGRNYPVEGKEEPMKT